MSWNSHRRVTSLTNAVFAGSIVLLPLVLFISPPFQLSEFSPPQVVYSRDLVSLLLAPWASPSSMFRGLSRLLQSALLLRLPNDSILHCYFLWIAIALTRTLVGFVFSRSVGWAYPRLFSHWALYESSGGYGPPLIAYLIASGVRLDLTTLLTCFKGHGWVATESFALLIVCALLAGLDHAPWTYSVSIMVAITLRVFFSSRYSPDTTYSQPSSDSLRGSPTKRTRTNTRVAFLLLAFILLSSAISAFLTHQPLLSMPTSSKDGAPLLEIILLSYPRPNDTPSSPDQHSILSQTIASYLPYVSPSTAFSVFTHAAPSTHPAFVHAQQRFKDEPITFYADLDTHPDAYPGQHLHLAEAFRWAAEKGATHAEWIILVEDDFPICGAWGWQGIVRVMHALQHGRTPTTQLWGGFVGTGGSGLILHRTLLPILAQTLRLHALRESPLPAWMPRRPADIIVQDCLLGRDPLCPTAPSSKDGADAWLVRRPTMVVTSRLAMDHVGGQASTAHGRMYDANKWRCGWRHPFHGRAEVVVVPI